MDSMVLFFVLILTNTLLFIHIPVNVIIFLSSHLLGSIRDSQLAFLTGNGLFFCFMFLILLSFYISHAYCVESNN